MHGIEHTNQNHTVTCCFKQRSLKKEISVISVAANELIQLRKYRRNELFKHRTHPNLDAVLYIEFATTFWTLWRRFGI